MCLLYLVAGSQVGAVPAGECLEVVPRIPLAVELRSPFLPEAVALLEVGLPFQSFPSPCWSMSVFRASSHWWRRALKNCISNNLIKSQISGFPTPVERKYFEIQQIAFFQLAALSFLLSPWWTEGQQLRKQAPSVGFHNKTPKQKLIFS